MIMRKTIVGFLLLVMLLAPSCSLTRLSAKRNKINEKSMEDARQNNSLAHHALERQPFTNRTVHTEVARVATEQNEKILGQPIRELDASAALNTNATNYEGVRADVEKNLGKEFGTQNDTEEKKRELEARLEEQGRLRVEEYKATVAKRWKWGIRIGGGILIIAGIIAACVYFPPLIGMIFQAFRTAKSATSALKNTVVANQKFFESAPAEHGAKLAQFQGREQGKEDEAIIRKIKADAYQAGEIETVSVPKSPPGDKPPQRSPLPGDGPAASHPIGGSAAAAPIGRPLP
jgi:hypothetical protein